MLTHVVGNHWSAVVRDVLDLGFRAKDIFTELTLEEMLAVVISAPPSSAVRHALDSGWSREAHLLANLTEQRAGLTDLAEPYARPGLEQRPPAAAPQHPVSNGVLQSDVMTWDEMTASEALRSSVSSGGTTVRKW